MTSTYPAIRHRHRVWLVLWVWVFALASGAVNACLVQERTSHPHSDRVHASDPTGARTVSVEHLHVNPGHADGGQLSSAQCLNVCDQTAQSPGKQQAQPDLGVPAAPPVFAPWAPVPPAALAALPVPDMRRDTAPPIRVRYVRLAL